MRTGGNLGAKVRVLRRGQRMTQVELARRLEISPSYLNLIEHNRRSFTADLLVKIAKILPVNLKTFSSEHDERTMAELIEVFGDPLFENIDVVANELRELAATHPVTSQAIFRLYEAYQEARGSVQNLTSKLSEDREAGGVPYTLSPTEEVSDLIQRHLNYFPALEQGAERLARDAELDDPDTIFKRLSSYLARTLGVTVRIKTTNAMESALRRYDSETQVLSLSEVLRRDSRNFHLAHQAGLLTNYAVLNQIASDHLLTSNESRALCRVALANYFAGAVLMPYEPFLLAAKSERYDIELLGYRFRTSFEQTCHRLTTLRRQGSEGVPFHMLRTDFAGNISKRFSASGLRFARFSGACPRWNVFEAFLTPGMARTQLSQMPDGQVFFDIASTVRKQGGGFKAPRTQYAIALGCKVSYAKELVYADGLDLSSQDSIVPVGPSCRLCERLDCEQRAFPPLLHSLTVNEQIRGVSFYAPLKT